FAREPSPLLGARQPGALGRQPAPLDGDANLVGNRREQPQLVGSQATPGWSSDVDDAEAPLLKGQGDTGMIAQAKRRLGSVGLERLAKAATFEHVDVRRHKLAAAKEIRAKTPAPTQSDWLLKVGR